MSRGGKSAVQFVFEQAWTEAFGTELGPVPKLVHAPCCAEFIVKRERILMRPRAFYDHVKSWIETTELDR
jgi:hypothetical protein